jgi:hypothetical protein
MKDCKVSWSGMTMWDLNKDNNAIKNDYIDNLIYLAWAAAPLAKSLGLEIEGFISLAKFNEVYKDLKDNELFWNKFRTSGNALKCHTVSTDPLKDNKIILDFLKTKLDKPISIVLFKDYMLIVQHDKYNGNLIEVIETSDGFIERVIR